MSNICSLKIIFVCLMLYGRKVFSPEDCDLNLLDLQNLVQN